MLLPANIEPIGQIVGGGYGDYAKTVGSQIEEALKRNYPAVQIGYESLRRKLVICNGPETALCLRELIQSILLKDPLPTVDEETLYQGCRTISLVPINFVEFGEPFKLTERPVRIALA